MKIPEKLFFSISEVSNLTGVKPYVLRYWESEFDLLKPEKNEAGNRRYRKKDVELILRIKELLYEDLYTIAGAKKRLQEEKRKRIKKAPILWISELKKELQEILEILSK
ncbi:MAG: MerR family transcriptional regulator [bacterium]|nr:MerR family transcriptional regulator [bacterium]